MVNSFYSLYNINLNAHMCYRFHIAHFNIIENKMLVVDRPWKRLCTVAVWHSCIGRSYLTNFKVVAR